LLNVVTSCDVQGKWYMLVEMLSQSYRCVLPITPWIYFLLDDEDSGSGRVSFASMLLLAYVGFKVSPLSAELCNLAVLASAINEAMYFLFFLS